MSEKSTKKEVKEVKEVKEEVTLEEMFFQIEGIIASMEDNDISLEESFTLYEQGIHKLKYCNDKIDAVEKKMLLLNSNGELEEF